MSSDRDNLDLAHQAERDLNSYQAKTGAGKSSSNDDSGVDTSVEKSFPGAEVKYGDDLTTNAGFNRRIPSEEGGDIDSRGRQTKGSHFEGEGGPEDELESHAADFGGENDNDMVNVPTNKEDGDMGQRSEDILSQGEDASRANVGSGQKIGGSNFKGDDYYTPESAPDSIAAQGIVPPDSVTESSGDTEQY